MLSHEFATLVLTERDYQRSIVLALLDKGLLRMNPDVQPFSAAFEAFLRTQAAQRQSDVVAWERVNVLTAASSWPAPLPAWECS